MAAGPRRVTRDEIVGLARQGRHWEFIPVAQRLLKQVPDDHGVRLLAATSYARLGLRTPALEHLDRLPTFLQDDQAVGALRATLGTMARDEVTPNELIARCDANAAVLSARGVSLEAFRDAWRERIKGERWFTTSDGNIARRGADASPEDAWLHFRNDRQEAENFPFPHLAQPGTAPKPYVIEGLFPAWMLLKLYELTPDGADGHRVRISVVQESGEEALDGLACTEMEKVLRDERVELFIGPGAGARYAASVRGRLDTHVTGSAVVLATVRTRAAPAVTRTLEECGAEQQAEYRRLAAEVERIYAGRTPEWWRRRYCEGDEPLRVLLPTCRYSTFVKHSAADLAEAFRGAGWDARVLMEPDDRSHLSAVAYLRQLAEFRPDLVVLINYTRSSVGDFFPATLPFVCWLQDAMPHQFDTAVAAKHGSLEFLVGYLHREMFREFGFPRERAAVFPVAASARKFHAGPVCAELGARLSCDIAYVSHHSETPAAMHERLVREAGTKEPLVGRIFGELRPEVERIARDSMGGVAATGMREAALRAARRVLGADPPARALTLVVRQYCMPMADRILRHETLGWAARIAARRGWRLRVFGRGWEKHPVLSRYAGGELAHDEELRAAYQLAGVHLHASSNWLLHQRVMECALSGGLPLSRLKKSDLVQWEQAVLGRLAHRGRIVMERLTPLRYREYGYAVADDAGAMEFTAQRQRLGLDASWDLWVHGARYDELHASEPVALEPPAGWYLGDLAETTFRTEEGLERLVERAIGDPEWRGARSRLIAERTRRAYTTDVLVGTIRGLVEKALHRASEPRVRRGCGPASSRSARLS